MQKAERCWQQTLLVLHMRLIMAYVVQPRKWSYGIVDHQWQLTETSALSTAEIQFLLEAVSSRIFYAYITVSCGCIIDLASWVGYISYELIYLTRLGFFRE